jgi:S1-C subfamily serine protease
MSLRSVSDRRQSLRLLSALAVIAIFSSQTHSARAQAVFDSIMREVRLIFERSKDAVVKIEAVDRHGQLSGTGFFIDPNGTLYTSYTIGGESKEIVVRRGELRYPARRLLGDSRSGIAILKVDAETPFLPLAKAQNLEVAAPVMTIGYPMDLPISPNFGMVAGFDVKYLGRYFSTSHIRANVPVQRGEGGSPLLNMKGEVVGVLISSVDNGAACFALPIEAAEKIRKDFIRFGETRPGWIGIHVGQAPKEDGGSAAQIIEIVDNAPAANSGLKKGDILLNVGGEKIESADDVLDASFFLTAGDEIPLVVARDGQKLTFEVQAADHPSNSRLHLQAHSPLNPRAVPISAPFTY